MSYLDLESAAIRAEEIGHHAHLLALAADGPADKGDPVGQAFRAGAEAIEEQLAALGKELDRLMEIWRLERHAGKADA